MHESLVVSFDEAIHCRRGASVLWRRRVGDAKETNGGRRGEEKAVAATGRGKPL
jgi:hypothetical protein